MSRCRRARRPRAARGAHHRELDRARAAARAPASASRSPSRPGRASTTSRRSPSGAAGARRGARRGSASRETVPAAWSGRRGRGAPRPRVPRRLAGLPVRGPAFATRRVARCRASTRAARRWPFRGEPGPVELVVEAASNPMLPQFRPTPLGSPATAGSAPLYRLRARRAGRRRRRRRGPAARPRRPRRRDAELPLDDPRRARIRAAIGRALDVLAAATRRLRRPGRPRRVPRSPMCSPSRPGPAPTA